MPGFLTPAWLLGLAALALPLLLHLWSRRPRQIVRLGSLRHLAGSPGPRAWGRILDDLPLLLLRLAVLAAVVLALAGLGRRTDAADPGVPRTVILADPMAVADSLAFFADPLVDSLRRSQTPLRYLAEGFPLLDVPASPPLQATPRDAWSLLAALDATLPDRSEIVVLARPVAGRLGGERPTLRSSVRWHDPSPVSSDPRPVRTWPGRGDTVVALVQERRGFTVVQRLVPSVPGGSMYRSPASGVPGENRLTVRSVPVTVVEVVSDSADSIDAQAMTAALVSASSVAFGITPEVRVSHRLNGGPKDPSTTVVVWLSGQSVSEEALSAAERGALLIEFPPLQEPIAVNSPLVPAGSSAAPPALGMATVFGRVASLEGAPVATDRAGMPLATVARRGAGLHVRIATRLDPGWSDLALSGALPELAHHLLTLGLHPADAAPVPASQTAPRQAAVSTPGPIAVRPWDSLLLLAAAALLLAERWMAHRPRAGHA